MHLSSCRTSTPKVVDPFKKPVDMSQSNPSQSNQNNRKDIKSPVTSKSDHSDQASSNAGKAKQTKDTAKGNPEQPQSPSTKTSTATKAVTPGLHSNSDKVGSAGGAPASGGIKFTSYPCGPCEWRELDCDGVRPICNNCEWNGRRCSYG